MKSIGFEFPEDLAEQWDGFNDPGIEHFTGNRLQHLDAKCRKTLSTPKRRHQPASLSNSAGYL